MKSYQVKHETHLMKDPLYFVNGKYVPSSKACLSVHDLSIIRSFCLFESLRTYSQKPFLLEQHLQRMKKGAKVSGLHLPYSSRQIQQIIQRLIHRNGFKGEVLIRMLLTGGVSMKLIPQGNPGFVVLTDALHDFPKWQYERGIKVMRIPASRFYPEIKTTVYFSAVVGTCQALKKGFHEVVYTLKDGSITEGSTFNVFAVLPGRRLITPQHEVLSGVTAHCVIRVAQKLGLKVEDRFLTPNIVRKANEVFITSGNREIIPVTQIDRQKIGNGKPGEITRQLHQLYLGVTKRG